MSPTRRPRRRRLLLVLLACGVAVAGLVVALAVLPWPTAAVQEAPEARRLRERLEAADTGWHDVELRTRTENGAKVTFAAAAHSLGNKRYSFMLLRREGAGTDTVEVEDAGESRLVAQWLPPADPSQTLPDAVLTAHWDEAKRLMRQLREAFEGAAADRPPP
jgi:hypothetical protein